LRADAGVVISASHNPYQDNGIKLFSGDGFKLPDDLELEIEKLVMEGSIDKLRPVASQVGKAHRIDDAVGRYIVFLKNVFPGKLSLDGLKMVVDCANGACYKVAPSVFEELGAHVVSYGVDPDGENINRGCGSTHPETLRELVLEHNAHIGIAFDGDGDRVVFVDEKGNTVDGDAVMAILAAYLKEKGSLKKDTLVATIQSNMGLEEYLAGRDVKVVRTNVGDRYVLETLLREGMNLGGEKSGHIVFLDHNTTGDGMVTALKMLNIMVEKEKTLFDLRKGFEEFPQVEKNVKVKKKKPIADIPALAAAIARIEGEFAGKGRVVVRYSGTEMLLRVMVEGSDKEKVNRCADEICDEARKHLGEE
jgi:phosphoglucosamine mutase